RAAQGPRPHLARADRGADRALRRRAQVPGRHAGQETGPGHHVRIIRLANFVAPHSGGLRTSLAELGAGYLVAGHEPVLVIPGDRRRRPRARRGAEWGAGPSGAGGGPGAGRRVRRGVGVATSGGGAGGPRPRPGGGVRCAVVVWGRLAGEKVSKPPPALLAWV